MHSLLSWEHYAGNFLVSKEPPHRPILLDFGLTKKLSSSIKQALAKMFLASAEVCTNFFVVFLSMPKLILCWNFSSYKDLYLMGKHLDFDFVSLLLVNALRMKQYYCVSHFPCSL